MAPSRDHERRRTERRKTKDGGTVIMKHGTAVRLGRGKLEYTRTSPQEGERVGIEHATSASGGTVIMKYGATVRTGQTLLRLTFYAGTSAESRLRSTCGGGRWSKVQKRPLRFQPRTEILNRPTNPPCYLAVPQTVVYGPTMRFP